MVEKSEHKLEMENQAEKPSEIMKNGWKIIRIWNCQKKTKRDLHTDLCFSPSSAHTCTELNNSIFVCHPLVITGKVCLAITSLELMNCSLKSVFILFNIIQTEMMMCYRKATAHTWPRKTDDILFTFESQSFMS